jgi:hypothetical protein
MRYADADRMVCCPMIEEASILFLASFLLDALEFVDFASCFLE